MAKKRSPASPERKKLREKRERASALSKQSSVKADKKQAWWCRKKKGPAYNDLPSSQRKKRKQEDRNITPSQKPKEWFVLWLLGAALSFYLLFYEYDIRLNTWFLSDPDTLYLDYGLLSSMLACIVALLDMVILGGALNAFFADLWERSHGEKSFRGFWRESAWGLFFLLAVLAVLHSLILISCLSRTEVTTTGASTYFMGIRTSCHSFEELTETEVYTTKSAGLGRGSTRHSVDNLNYILRFQDGYELHLVHSSLDRNFVHGWNSKTELDNIVLPLAPQKTALDRYKSG